jgi:hypothetical protein
VRCGTIDLSPSVTTRSVTTLVSYSGGYRPTAGEAFDDKKERGGGCISPSLAPVVVNPCEATTEDWHHACSGSGGWVYSEGKGFVFSSDDVMLCEIHWVGPVGTGGWV